MIIFSDYFIILPHNIAFVNCFCFFETQNGQKIAPRGGAGEGMGYAY